MSTKISCEDRRPLNLRMDGVLQGSENNVGFHELQRRNLDLPPIQKKKRKKKKWGWGVGEGGGGAWKRSHFACRFGPFTGGILLTTTFSLGRSVKIPFSDLTIDLLAALGYFGLMSLIPQ